MKLQEKVSKIDKNYTHYKIFHLNTTEKIYLGSKENKKCRFCEKSVPEVSFKMIAHAIPEFVNNHKLISYYECDSCNSKFSRTIETHMGDYMNVYHSLSQVKGKKGVPSFRRANERSRIDHSPTALKIDSYEDDSENFIIDEVNKTITFKSIRATYVPIAIYKCLTKMALTIMDEEELIHFENALKWINEETHDESEFKISNLRCVFSITPGPLPHDFTTCILLKRKDNHVDNVPYMQFLLAYGNFTFQIFLIMSSKDQNKTIFSITPYPTPYDFKNIHGSPEYKVLDFSSTKPCKNDEVNLTLSYDKMTRIKDNEK